REGSPGHATKRRAGISEGDGSLRTGRILAVLRRRPDGGAAVEGNTEAMSGRVFLGGEGPNELGSLARDPSYQPADPEPGVLETLLRSVERDGWEVAGAVTWKRIVKYKAKGPMNAEKRNVLGLALDAERAEAH